MNKKKVEKHCCRDKSPNSRELEEKTFTVKGRGNSSLVDNHLSLEHGEEVSWFFALNNSDLNCGSAKTVVKLDGLQSGCALLVDAGMGAL